MLRSCHYNWENINWVNLKSQIFQKKQSQWKQAKQTKVWYRYPSYMNIETWKIYLPVIILSENIQGCCIEKYISMSEDWSHKGNKGCARVHLADQSFSSLRWLCLFWNSKDLYKTTHFCFWYQTETFKHHEKWNSWGQEKCPAPPLNLNSPVWIFSSFPISKLIPKSVEHLMKIEVGDDTIVVTTLNETDILIGQVYCEVGLSLGVGFRE